MATPNTLTTDSTLRLRDGRALGYMEVGKKDGSQPKPTIFGLGCADPFLKTAPGSPFPFQFWLERICGSLY